MEQLLDCEKIELKLATPQINDRNYLISPNALSEQQRLAKRKKMYQTRERLAEQQRLRELHDSSYKWLWYALLSGLTCGLGNYIMGIKLIDAGAFGPGFTGPLGLLILDIRVTRVTEITRVAASA